MSKQPDTTITIRYGTGADCMKVVFHSGQLNEKVGNCYLHKQYQLLVSENANLECQRDEALKALADLEHQLDGRDLEETETDFLIGTGRV